MSLYLSFRSPSELQRQSIITLREEENECDELLDNINSRMDFAHQRRLQG